MERRIGPAGWSYPDWQGIVYPMSRPTGFHELPFLARYFDTVEINSSFYRPLTLRMVSGWLQRLKPFPRFKFTAKLWNRFTHEDEPPRLPDVRACCEGLHPLRQEGRLGALLMQFPWSFRRGRQEGLRLLQLIEAFQEFPLVLEVRHSSWNEEAVRDALRRRNVALCNVDQPVIRSSLPPSAHVTSPVAYLRLHGRNYQTWFAPDAGRDQRYDYLYSAEEISELAGLVQSMESAPAGVEEVYVITNNHFRGQAVVNALQIESRLSGQPVRAPLSLIGAYPQLQEIWNGLA